MLRVPSVLLSCVVLFVASNTWGQEDRLRKQYDEKLAKEFATRIPWQRSLKDAVKLAKEEGKPIFAYFTCTDTPSPPSGRIEDGPFVAEWFLELSKDFVPYMHITSGLRDEPDRGMFSRKGGRMKPYLLLLDAKGVTFFEVKPFFKRLDSFPERFPVDVADANMLVSAQLAKKSAKVKARVTILQTLRGLGNAGPRKLRSSAKALRKRLDEADASLLTRCDRYLELLPFNEIREECGDKTKAARKALNPGAITAAEHEAAKKMYALYKRGKKVTYIEEDVYYDYWRWVTEAAIRAGNKKDAQTAYQELLKVSTFERKSAEKTKELKEKIDDM